MGKDKKLRDYWEEVLEEKNRNAYVAFPDEERFTLAIDYLGQIGISSQIMPP